MVKAYSMPKTEVLEDFEFQLCKVVNLTTNFHAKPSRSYAVTQSNKESYCFIHHIMQQLKARKNIIDMQHKI